MTFASPHASFRALGCLLAALGVCGRSAFAQPPPPAPPDSTTPVSASAQRVYQDARAQLLQVRTLLKGQDTQASVGSGFLVSDQGHIITNYHVVSQAALQPERYRLVFSTADRTEGPLQLLAFDAIHDLALVKPVRQGQSPAAARCHSVRERRRCRRESGSTRSAIRSTWASP